MILNDEIAEKLGLGQNAEGAYIVGTEVQKTHSEEGDGNPDGTLGVVKGSKLIDMLHPDNSSINVKYIYFVEFVGFPVPIFIVDYKIKLKENNIN